MIRRLKPDIHIAVEGIFVRVTYRGKVTYDDATEMLRDVARISAQAKKNRLLFDLREASYKGYYAETIAHTNEAPGLGIDKTFRVAFVGTEDHAAMLRFMEDAIVNRGYQAKVFLDDAEAVAWVSGAA